MNPDSRRGPVSRVDPRLAYARSIAPEGIRLKLDANEGAESSLEAMLATFRGAGAELLRRYPDAGALETALARRYDVDPSQVFVTAGADEAIDRCCRAYLGAGTSILLTDPTFEMFERYASLAGGAVDRVPWTPGPFPIDGMLARAGSKVGLIAVVTPNNPTGEVATVDGLRSLADAAPSALVVLDHAYAEYADEDLTAAALWMPNVVIVRTFSKAWGLAGCRVGYVMGPAGIIASLRAAGGPFTVAAPSIAFAAAQLEQGAAARDAHVSRVREERDRLFAFLDESDARPRRSQANFVYAELGARAAVVHAALRRQGVLVRLFAESRGSAGGLRITVPGHAVAFAELMAALSRALAPDVEVTP
jgi:histidinol-phosphate aminotransferase